MAKSRLREPATKKLASACIDRSERALIVDPAEFAPRRGIVITADAVSVLLDDGTTASHPFAIAFDEFGFLLSIARTRHALDVWIDRAPSRGAGKTAERCDAALDLDPRGLGRRDWRSQQH